MISPPLSYTKKVRPVPSNVSLDLVLIIILAFTPPRPIQPTPSVIPHVFVTAFTREFSCCSRTFAGPAIEDDVLVREGFSE